jgi:hypothetical protein
MFAVEIVSFSAIIGTPVYSSAILIKLSVKL